MRYSFLRNEYDKQLHLIKRATTWKRSMLRNLRKGIAKKSGTTAYLRSVINAYIFEESTRSHSLSILQQAVVGKEASRVVRILCHQLQPRWSDYNHATRQQMAIEICSSIDSLDFLAICSGHRKMMENLDYHLRVCTYIDFCGQQKFSLARNIQSWLDTVVATYAENIGLLEGISLLQQKYKSVWLEIDFHACNQPAWLENTVGQRRLPGAQPLSTIQRALPSFGPRRIYMTLEQITNSLMKTNILCFDILKTLLQPACDLAILQQLTKQAEEHKIRLAQISNLEVRAISRLTMTFTDDAVII